MPRPLWTERSFICHTNIDLYWISNDRKIYYKSKRQVGNSKIGIKIIVESTSSAGQKKITTNSFTIKAELFGIQKWLN
jgi:hypothetical protein